MNVIKTEAYTGKRVAATFIDYLIIISFTIWYIMSFGEPNGEGGRIVKGWPALMPAVFWFAWLIIPESIWGTTAGHHLNGLKIISLDGEKPGIGQAFKRRLCDIIEICWCLGIIALILVKNTRFHQRLGDIWAKVLVVDRHQNLDTGEFDFEKV